MVFRTRDATGFTGCPIVDGVATVAALDGAQPARTPLSAPLASRWHRPRYDSSRRLDGGGPAVRRTPCQLAGTRTSTAPSKTPETGGLDDWDGDSFARRIVSH